MGLEQEAARSSISSIENGELRYSGYLLNDLAEFSHFEEVVFLLWHRLLPSFSELEKLKHDLAANRELPAPLLETLKALPPTTPPMDVLRTLISAHSAFDLDRDDQSLAANLRKGVRLTALLPRLLTQWEAFRTNQKPFMASLQRNFAARFLDELRGREVDDAEIEALDKTMIVHADHEFNISTFAGRLAASTDADLHSSVVAAISTLKGPLHGGANQKVMEMLTQIGDVSRVEKILDEFLLNKTKVSGFGHLIYKNGDPRATFMKKISERLSQNKKDFKWFEISSECERLMKEKKGILPNVDFYSASVYALLRIPTDLFPTVFAISRMPGWVAHSMEQMGDTRILIPRATYTGTKRVAYQPIAERRPA